MTDKTQDDGEVTSCMVGVDADLIPRLLRFYGVFEGQGLDCTYGDGRFWEHDRPPRLITIDVFMPAMVRANNEHLPFATGCFDYLVYDPPHLARGRPGKDPPHGGGLAARYRPHWTGIPDWHQFTQEAGRVLRAGGFLISKIGDEITRLPWNHVALYEAAEWAGLNPYDLIIKKRPSSLVNRRQHQRHARRNHCFYLVFQNGR